MSINIVFDVNNTKEIVDFSYQTPTSLTFEILGEQDNQKRIKILKNHLEKVYTDKEIVESIMIHFCSLLDAPNLTLSCI